ncbi:PAS domain-containing protein [Candidatus Poribacteria bacterium]|nr:PAS domain-containing protein [Candidatus Poribacteria bacterium]
MLTYEDLLFVSSDGVLDFDKNMSVRRCNQVARVMIGYRSGELKGKHISDILHDQALIKHLTDDSRGSDWLYGESVLYAKGGMPVPVKLRAALISSDEDLDKHLVLIVEKLQESDKSLQHTKLRAVDILLNSIAESTLEPDNILLQFARVFDKDAKTILLPSDIADSSYVSPLTQPEMQSVRKAINRKEAVIYYNDNLSVFFPITTNDEILSIARIKFSNPRFYDLEDRKIFTTAGKIMGIYLSKSSSDKLDLKEQFIPINMLDNFPQAIVIVDKKGNISFCNQTACDLYGYEKSSMINNSFCEMVFPADYHVECQELLESLLEGESVDIKKIDHIRRDLSIVSVNLNAHPFRSDEERIIGAIFFIYSLQEKTKVWERMMQWERLVSMGELLSNVANELNNRFTPLTVYSQMLLNRKDGDDINSMVSKIYEESERCAEIVRNVLAIAKENEFRREKPHINDLIRSALKLKRHQLWENNIDVYTRLGRGMPGTVPNSSSIQRLILRIMQYAEQRMVEYDNGGRLTITTKYEDGYIIIQFEDTGTCILEDDIERMRDPFSFDSYADNNISLGLSISCQVLRNMGGNIRIYSQIGKGNTITLEIPSVDEKTGISEETTDESEIYSLETGKKIMVVDDDPDVVDLLSTVLNQMGHIADIARDGNEAMEKLEFEEYDLIISDLRMPCGFTGDRLHKFIERKDPKLAKRMIFITGDVTNPDTQKFLQETGNPYLEKPFQLVNLRETIQKLLGQQ